MIRVARSALGGFLMGTADLVPGVSGGTIALVLGIYERLVASVKEGSSALGSMLKGDLDGLRSGLRRVDWLFLLPLIVGVLAAVALLAGFLERQLEERPAVVAGVFLGLVLGSVFIAWGLMRAASGRHMVVTAAVGAALFLLLGFGEGRGGADPSLPAYFGAGALAVCAMILPGISGSLILLMIGMYAPVLGAVASRELVAVGVVAAGAIAGLAVFSQILHWALKNHHDNVLAALIGLMAGSLRVLWPWPEGVQSAALGAPGADWAIVLVSLAAGWAAVLVISRLEPGGVTERPQPGPAG